MNATGLPIPAGLPTTVQASAPASAIATAPGDFLLMLGQLLGAGAAKPPLTAAAPLASNMAASNTESATAETADGAAAMAMLPIVPMMPWSNPQSLPAASEAAADAIGSLNLSLATDGSAGRTDSIAADSMTRDAQLLASLDTLQTNDASVSIQTNLNAAQSIDAAQGLRAVVGSDTAGTRALHQPVGSSAWAEELGTRMTWMADRGQHSASLRLSPEHLGPLEVRIAIRDDQASVWFGAAHADTRAAIEQALPRLRELFASQGLSLADAGVFHEPPREQPRLPSSLSSSPEAEAEAIAQVGPIRLGLVDAYA